MHWIALGLGVFIGFNLLLLIATLHWGPGFRAGDDADNPSERRVA